MAIRPSTHSEASRRCRCRNVRWHRRSGTNRGSTCSTPHPSVGAPSAVPSQPHLRTRPSRTRSGDAGGQARREEHWNGDAGGTGAVSNGATYLRRRSAGRGCQLHLRMRPLRARSGGRGGHARREEQWAAGAGGAGAAPNGPTPTLANRTGACDTRARPGRARRPGHGGKGARPPHVRSPGRSRTTLCLPP
jgi:hypothetical protein